MRDQGFERGNGFDEGAYLLFIFYLYPLVGIVRGKEVFRIAGVACGLTPWLGLRHLIWIIQRDVFTIRVHYVNGSGATLFALSCIVFTVGNCWFRKFKSGASPSPP